MNNILKKSLVAFCIMSSSCLTISAGWGDILGSVKKCYKNNSSEFSNAIEDAKKESFISIKNELKKCMDKTFSKENMLSFWASNEKTDRAKNCFYLAGNILSAALDKTKVDLSDNKKNIAQACEKALNGGKELVKNKACDLFNPVGITVNVLNGNEIVTKAIDECVNSEYIKRLSEQAADVVEKNGISAINKAQCYLNNVKNTEVGLLQCTEDADDWTVVEEMRASLIHSTLSVPNLTISG